MSWLDGGAVAVLERADRGRRTTNEVRQAGRTTRSGGWEQPVIMVVAADGARIEVATAADHGAGARRPADRVPIRQPDADDPGGMNTLGG